MEKKKTSRLPSSALVASFLVALVSWVTYTCPECFFRIPHLGFIIHTIATGKSLPPYFTPDAWEEEEMKTWIRNGDVVVAAGVKAGTHWMLYCTHQIRTKAADDADDLFGDVNHGTPWTDLLHNPGGTWSDQKDHYNTTVLSDGSLWKDHWDNARYPFRIFKSHYGPKEQGGVIDIRAFPDVKFIAMARDGLDVVRSAIPFFNDHMDWFRQMWGGFPQKTPDDREKGSEVILNGFLPGGMIDSLYFKYVKQWWAVREEKNVLLLHYADAIKDLHGVVKKIADFVGVDLSDEAHREVTRRCGMDYMKSIHHRFNIRLPLNKKYPDAAVLKPGKLLRSGKIGEGQAYFNEEQKARWKAAEEAEFEDPDLLRWARHGGEFSAK